MGRSALTSHAKGVKHHQHLKSKQDSVQTSLLQFGSKNIPNAVSIVDAEVPVVRETPKSSVSAITAADITLAKSCSNVV